MKAIFWHDEAMGAEYTVDEVPANLLEEAEEWRDKMLETLAEFDETLMEKYFDDPSSITVDEIKAAIRKATLSMAVNPMICGSSFKNKGVQTLLDAVCAYLPSPEDSGVVEGHAVGDPDEVETREPSTPKPRCVLLHLRLQPTPMLAVCASSAYIQVRSSRAAMCSIAAQARRRESLAFSRCTPTSRTRKRLSVRGDIGAGVGFKDIRTGDTLCDENAPIVLESMEFPDPVIGIAVEPKTQKDLDKLGVGLQKLAEEDPTFRVETNEETGQTVISGMGELHLDIIIDRLRREFKVECNQGRPSGYI